MTVVIDEIVTVFRVFWFGFQVEPSEWYCIECFTHSRISLSWACTIGSAHEIWNFKREIFQNDRWKQKLESRLFLIVKSNLSNEMCSSMKMRAPTNYYSFNLLWITKRLALYLCRAYIIKSESDESTVRNWILNIRNLCLCEASSIRKRKKTGLVRDLTTTAAL